MRGYIFDISNHRICGDLLWGPRQLPHSVHHTPYVIVNNPQTVSYLFFMPVDTVMSIKIREMEQIQLKFLITKIFFNVLPNSVLTAPQEISKINSQYVNIFIQ